MASIENVSILITTDEGLQDALQGVIANGFTLTSYTDGTGVPTLSSGRTAEINNALYRVIDGDLAVDITSIGTDGVKYIYVEDTGSTVTAKALSTSPTWRGDLGGWFLSGASTSKAFFRFVKSGTSYNFRTNLLQIVTYLPADTTITNLSVSGTMIGNLTGSVTNNNSSVGSLPPIGSIIGLHPDVKSTLGLDTTIWSPCNGLATLPTENFNTTNDTKVPYLTDDRFVMGASVYGVGGTGTYALADHSHTVASHNHQWHDAISSGTGAKISSVTGGNKSSYNSSGTRIAFENSTELYNNYYTSNTAPGTSSAGATTVTITPKYFKAIYYIRIK